MVEFMIKDICGYNIFDKWSDIDTRIIEKQSGSKLNVINF